GSEVEDELRSLKLRDTNIAVYTQRFNELVLLCPEVVPTEKKKVEAYIKGLLENIKGEKGLPKETRGNGKTIKMAIERTTTEETTRTTPATINTSTRDKEMHEQ
nr:reverse transcriptase domain-containing protein [Tanacetum cinerariifolium]